MCYLFLKGVLMISLALVADAIIGNVQEKAMKKYGASNSEVVFYSYSFGVLYLVFALVVTGRLTPAVVVANKVFYLYIIFHLT